MIEPLEAEERGRLNLEASRLIGWEYIIREGDFTLKDGSNHRCMLRLVARDGSISTSGAPGSGEWDKQRWLGELWRFAPNIMGDAREWWILAENALRAGSEEGGYPDFRWMGPDWKPLGREIVGEAGEAEEECWYVLLDDLYGGGFKVVKGATPGEATVRAALEFEAWKKRYDAAQEEKD